jgi:hypothetical protein
MDEKTMRRLEEAKDKMMQRVEEVKAAQANAGRRLAIVTVIAEKTGHLRDPAMDRVLERLPMALVGGAAMLSAS